MRLLILSDLHHELWREHAPRIDPSISQPDAVVLAGDINTGAKAVQWAAETFPGLPVLYVHGNHEGYGHAIDDMQREIKEACSTSGNVHFLNCGELTIGNVRFLGATMWTDFKLFGDEDRPAAMRECQERMNDYKRVRLAKQAYRKLRAGDTAQYHAIQKSWLKQKLSEPFDGKTIVITHMAPSYRSVPDEFALDRISSAYASVLDDLVAQADVWVHGHMHESLDYHIEKCRVVCNPCGYMTRGGGIENSNFNSNFIVEVGI